MSAKRIQVLAKHVIFDYDYKWVVEVLVPYSDGAEWENALGHFESESEPISAGCFSGFGTRQEAREFCKTIPTVGIQERRWCDES